jgi:adenylate kinase
VNKKVNKKQVVVIIGSPGAGKGTQANLLSEKFGFYHWETSKIVGRIIEKAPKDAFVEIDGKKYYFEEQKNLRERGKLWDPPFLVYFIKKKIEKLAKEGESIILIGSPRTVYEAKRVVPLLKELYGVENIKVLYIKITAEEAVWRNTHRRECDLVHHPVLYSEETAKLTKCQLDGSKLVKRKDDRPEIIKTRLKEFKERTLPLFELFKKENLEIIEIDGAPPPVDVFKSILSALNLE